MPSVSRRSVTTAEVDCSPTVLVGHLVYIDGAQSVNTVDTYEGAKMPARGLVIGKASATRATVQYTGAIPEGVLSGLTPGATYLAGVTGVPATTPPPGPTRRYVQHVGTALSSTVLLLSFQDPTIMR